MKHGHHGRWEGEVCGHGAACIRVIHKIGTVITEDEADFACPVEMADNAPGAIRHACTRA